MNNYKFKRELTITTVGIGHYFSAEILTLYAPEV